MAAVAVLAIGHSVIDTDDTSSVLLVIVDRVLVAGTAIGFGQRLGMGHGGDAGVAVGAAQIFMHTAGQSQVRDFRRLATSVVVTIGADLVGDFPGHCSDRQQDDEQEAQADSPCKVTHCL